MGGRTASIAGFTGLLLRWYTWATCAVAVVCVVGSRAIATQIGVETWTPLAAGLVFLANRWRSLGVDVLEVARARRSWTVQNCGFLVLQLVALATVLPLFGASATNALLAYAAAAALFGGFVASSLLAVASPSTGAGGEAFRSMVVGYGVPAALLLFLQAVQSFADRYILGFWVDLDAVGRYVASYQVVGVPYMLLMGTVQALCLPIAFQRARDVGSPHQVWAGDRVILGAIVVYTGIGLVGLGAFAMWGEQAMRVVHRCGIDGAAGGADPARRGSVRAGRVVARPGLLCRAPADARVVEGFARPRRR